MGYNNYRQPNQYERHINRRNTSSGYNTRSYDIVSDTLPANYVDQAEQIMKELSQSRSRLTTSKLRNILSRISDIYNVEVDRTESELLDKSYSGLQMTRVRIAYECGREESVKMFVQAAKLLEYIKGIGKSREQFICFARYMEALVAYHRFYGGKDQ